MQPTTRGRWSWDQTNCINDKTEMLHLKNCAQINFNWRVDAEYEQIQTRQNMSPPHLLSAWTHLVTIVGPGAKGQVALLPVKWEVGHIHHTCALCDGGRVPHNLSIIPQLHVGAGWTCRLLICPTQTKRAMHAVVEALRKTYLVYWNSAKSWCCSLSLSSI